MSSNVLHRRVLGRLAAVALTGLSLAVAASSPASAAAAPSVVGSTFGDASGMLTSAGFRPVVSSTVGGRKSRAECVVVSQRQTTIQPPANTSASGTTPTDVVLVSLNCLAAKATATSPGFSAASPEGQAELKKAAASR